MQVDFVTLFTIGLKCTFKRVNALWRSWKISCWQFQQFWLLRAPKNVLTQNFVFMALFGHNINPLDHWNPQNNFSNRVAKSTSRFTIKLSLHRICLDLREAYRLQNGVCACASACVCGRASVRVCAFACAHSFVCARVRVWMCACAGQRCQQLCCSHSGVSHSD